MNDNNNNTNNNKLWKTGTAPPTKNHTECGAYEILVFVHLYLAESSLNKRFVIL